MILIYGRQTARIKKYTDNQYACQNCKAFDLDVRVYRDYYHLVFIPVFPVGKKRVEIHCKNCGEPMRLDAIKKQYENINKTPFYLFIIPILFAILILFLVYENLATQKEKAILVANPQVGDIYTIRKDENNKIIYFFLRLVRINGDTVVAYHSNLEYSRYTSTLHEDDFFVKDEELYFLKSDLKKMLNDNEINSVARRYSK
jgi:hypothetical protein